MFRIIRLLLALAVAFVMGTPALIGTARGDTIATGCALGTRRKLES